MAHTCISAKKPIAAPAPRFARSGEGAGGASAPGMSKNAFGVGHAYGIIISSNKSLVFVEADARSKVMTFLAFSSGQSCRINLRRKIEASLIGWGVLKSWAGK